MNKGIVRTHDILLPMALMRLILHLASVLARSRRHPPSLLSNLPSTYIHTYVHTRCVHFAVYSQLSAVMVHPSFFVHRSCTPRSLAFLRGDRRGQYPTSIGLLPSCTSKVCNSTLSAASRQAIARRGAYHRRGQAYPSEYKVSRFQSI